MIYLKKNSSFGVFVELSRYVLLSVWHVMRNYRQRDAEALFNFGRKICFSKLKSEINTLTLMASE